MVVLGKKVCEEWVPILPTKKQDWAQKRNMEKGRVKSLCSNLRRMEGERHLTPQERHEMRKARLALLWVLSKWEEQNPKSRADFCNGRRG